VAGLEQDHSNVSVPLDGVGHHLPVARLEDMQWPGHVREQRHVLEREEGIVDGSLSTPDMCADRTGEPQAPMSIVTAPANTTVRVILGLFMRAPRQIRCTRAC